VPPDPERARRKAADEREEMRIGFRMMGLAWQMVTEVLAGAGLGWVADHFAGTAPLWLAIGAGLGIVVSIYSLVRGGLSMNAYLEQRSKRVERPGTDRPEGGPRG
jgi:F0F1-type ATP synthase assembly protein I